jgi:hypothetical protein
MVPKSPPAEKPKVSITIRQGKGGTANPSVIAAPIIQHDCGVVQNGGTGNTASPTCNPPVNPNAGVVTYSCYGNPRNDSVGITTLLDVQPSAEWFKRAIDLDRKEQYAALLIHAKAGIKEFPEWLTPYLFAGESDYFTGNIHEMRTMATAFDKSSGPAYGEGACKSLADALHKAVQQTASQP